jgi:predicted phosphatase
MRGRIVFLDDDHLHLDDIEKLAEFVRAVQVCLKLVDKLLLS